MTKALPALASVALLTAQGLLSLVLGACAFPQYARPADTLNPSLFQLQHTAWTERDGAPPAINGITQAPDGSWWLGSGEGLYRFDGFTFERVRAIDGTLQRRRMSTRSSPLRMAASGSELRIMAQSCCGTEWRSVSRSSRGFRSIRLYGVWQKSWTEQFAPAQHQDSSSSNGSQWRSVGKAWGFPEMVGVDRLRLDSNGTLWAAANKHGLFRLKRGLRHCERRADLPREYLTFDESPSGEYWASTRSGIRELAEVSNGTAGLHCVVHEKRSATSPFFAYSQITFDRRGNLWMRSWKSGGIERLNAAAFRDAFRPGHLKGRWNRLPSACALCGRFSSTMSTESDAKR
jgi:hypothetical protein